MPGLTNLVPAQTQAVAGDDWFISFTLYEDGNALDFHAGTCQVAVRSLNQQQVIAPVAQANSGGASWSTGLLIVSIPSASTLALTKMEYFLEIQVTLNGRLHTWPLVPVEVIQSTIV